jgi:5-hydroxyisourate hydrolase-like protein (transthyretin family)
MNKTMLGVNALLTACLFFQCVEKNMAGSVTQTGNVTGMVIVKESQKPAAGASIAFFRKKTVLVSPDESFAPAKTVYTDNKGRFHADLDDGAYTVVASNGDK